MLRRVDKAIDMVGLKGLYESDFLALSEGQKQLCILARTIIEASPLLLLDEPDSALDFSNHINSFIHTPEHICGVASKYVHMRIEAKQTYIPDGHAYSKIVSLGNVAYELCLFFNREVFK